MAPTSWGERVSSFDGRVRESPPSIGRWIAYSFLLTLCYWIALSLLLPDVVAEVLASTFAGPFVGAVLARIIPPIAALLLTIPLRISWSSGTDWAINLVAAGIATGFAYFIALFVVVLVGASK